MCAEVCCLYCPCRVSRTACVPSDSSSVFSQPSLAPTAAPTAAPVAAAAAAASAAVVHNA